MSELGNSYKNVLDYDLVRIKCVNHNKSWDVYARIPILHIKPINIIDNLTAIRNTS